MWASKNVANANISSAVRNAPRDQRLSSSGVGKLVRTASSKAAYTVLRKAKPDSTVSLGLMSPTP